MTTSSSTLFGKASWNTHPAPILKGMKTRMAQLQNMERFGNGVLRVRPSDSASTEEHAAFERQLAEDFYSITVGETASRNVELLWARSEANVGMVNRPLWKVDSVGYHFGARYSSTTLQAEEILAYLFYPTN